ncbi:CMP-N-acetylneuraminate-poly-alpha-2,8-sialyltransferase-like isoform X1 [Anneissia japonica]|uniref:CMP-N-acetylneuraminate-poly-alpha-2, 8-sialyltransferase-like isoform X1 n=1 Tax=Anneissia japonica TaxID=1529436 RepID=UPI001425880F|nr:CMP-N-acetylneuraminate-poly-alpha-2,8-sialyltransferase-like isoform X1 [Anneissia japonica]
MKSIKTTDSRRSTMFRILICLMCFAVLSTYVAIHWPTHYPAKLQTFSLNKTSKLKETKNESLILTENPQVKNMKKALEAAFDKHISLEVVLRMRSRLKKLGLSSNLTIYIPPHQLDDEKLRFYRYKRIKKRPVGQFIPQQRTCAVIGNSGILLGSKCGAEIDAHDFVLRSNMAPTKRYKDDVGNKTNLMTINSKASKIALKCVKQHNKYPCPENHLNIFQYLEGSIIWFSKFGSLAIHCYTDFVKYFRKTNLDLLIAYPYKPIRTQIQRFWKMRYSPSSGLFLYTVSVPICDRISLYGFYPFSTAPDGRNIPYHYYENISFESGHNMTHEFSKLLALRKQRYFRMVTDKCNL